jgi:lysophospholipase L1-like esterase
MAFRLTLFFSACLSLGAIVAAAAPPSPAGDDSRSQIQRGNPNIQVRGDLEAFQYSCDASKTVHIAFLGGSITQNTGGHTALVPEWLRERFPETEFTVTNAGLGSTCSTSGAFRVGDHILSKGPIDLVIVEFAVNDDQDAVHARRECVRGMEGIIRQVREQSPDTAIIMVHYVNPPMLEKLQGGETPVSIDAHEAVAKHYGITSVNVAAEVADAIESGKYTWQDYGGTHPKAFGYGVASNMINAALDEGFAIAPSSALSALPAPLDAGSYTGGVFVDPEETERSGDWKIGKVSRELIPEGGIREQYLEYQVLRGDVSGAELAFDFEGRAVGAFILAGPDAGKLETSIDGGPVTTHDLYHRFSRKLNYPRSVIFASDLEPGSHRLMLRISEEKNPDSNGHAASILFFEVNE